MTRLLPNNGVIMLEQLRQYKLLNCAPDKALDDLTRLAAKICQAPVALICLIDEHQQWLKSEFGLSTTKTKPYLDFCSYAILQQQNNLSKLLIIKDTLTDERFATNLSVTSTPNIRFYAGIPLVTPDGNIFGVLSIIDYVTRDLNKSQQEALQDLSYQVISYIETRLTKVKLQIQENLTNLHQIITRRKQMEEILQQSKSRKSLHKIPRETQPETELTQIPTLVDKVEKIEARRNLEQEKGLPKNWDDKQQVETERFELLAREQAARAEAEAERNRTRNILESISDGFFALDKEWRFTYLNSRTAQILFRNRDELISANIWEEFPELIGSTFELEFKRSVSKQVTALFEAFYPVLGIWFEARVYPYEEGLSIYLRDVTERKQTEAFLLERSLLATVEAEVGKALGHSSTLAESLNRSTQAMQQYLDATFAAIWTFNEQTELLELQALASAANATLPDPDLFAHPHLHLDGSAIGFIAQTRQPYLTQDSSQPSSGGLESRLYNGELAESCSTIADNYLAGYPLIVDDRLVGVMAIARSQTFSDIVHSTLSTLSNTIAVGIDRSWAREALLSRWEALLFRLASQIRNSLDLDTILGTAVNEIQSLLKVDRCHFVWCWPHPTNPSVSVTHEALQSADVPSLLTNSLLEKMTPLTSTICELQTLRIDEISPKSSKNNNTTETLLNDSLSSLDITSVLLVPLKTRAGQLGAIVCNHCTGTRHWSEGEVELLKAVVDQLAIAIDQAELFAQTRAAAFAAQTQAKQLEIALQELKQTESRMIQTEKMSSLGQMVAGIAHEINNPVGFITGNLAHTGTYVQDLLDLIGLYKECYPNPDAKVQEREEEIDLEFLIADLPKMLVSMSMGAERIRQIVVSLRNFSRLDESEKKPVDIHEGIDNTLLILQHRFKPSGSSKGIEIIKQYGQLPLIECYAGQLNQVFMNILSNAIDAIEPQPDPRIITINTELLDADNVVIHIRDNGPGIPDNVKKRLFDPFFTTKPVGKGTGLGLSISYQIIAEKHRGVLKCLSEPGKGTEFWIQIPLNL